jgi:hypothetical protein
MYSRFAVGDVVGGGSGCRVVLVTVASEFGDVGPGFEAASRPPT